ncbi:MAG TPA: bile acid:sodium symporter family protein [Steroidobacteraceae bacterium]|nr:bile acid:sodium symporter family protein [Steroidobacteraceae bacterium]
MHRLFAALRPDSFTVMIVATVVLASIAPAAGVAVPLLDAAVKASVMALFFLHGARLAREAVLQAIGHWRLQLLILASTYLAFPLLGLAAGALFSRVLEPTLYLGFLFLCCLPSTVQSSIAFTSVGRGNVPAAACAASASNLLGIFVTPLLTGLLLARQGEVTFGAIGSIVLLLLVPFVAGQVARPWLGGWVSRRRLLLTTVDRGAILLMIYAAFGKAVEAGVWQRISGVDLALVVVVSLALLAAAVTAATLAARRLGFARGDEVAIVFCGSMKSLVTGLPMANVLFPGAQAGILVIPLIVFHQVQLLACAVLARRYGQERRVGLSSRDA